MRTLNVPEYLRSEVLRIAPHRLHDLHHRSHYTLVLLTVPVNKAAVRPQCGRHPVGPRGLALRSRRVRSQSIVWGDTCSARAFENPVCAEKGRPTPCRSSGQML
jgi:hypothetical protein